MHRLDRRIPLSRRVWLGAVAAGWIARSALGDDAGALPEDERERRAVEERAREVGLGPIKTTRSAHYYQALGDGPDTYRARVLEVCEAVAADYLEHYRSRGFDVTPPARRLTVVVLSGAEAFGKFLGQDLGPEVGGIYDLDTNALVVYDFRSQPGQNLARPQFLNLLSLAHEATHQLTFNTGLLDRRGDIPLCVTEGLAMYGEVRDSRNPTHKSPPGRDNRARLAGLVRSRRQGDAWIPIPSLIASDRVLRGEDGLGPQQVGYAESWLLVHFLMKTPTRLPGFRAYLAAIRPRRDGAHRLDDAREHLGELEGLDRELKQYGRKLLRKL